MSYDIQIGDKCFNYTSNVSALFYDHIPASEGGRGGLHELDGKTGVVGEPEFCARYDAPNGWGSTVGGLILLSQVMAACYQNPRKRVSVCA